LLKIPSDLMIEQLEMDQMPLPKGICSEVQELDFCTLTEVQVKDREGATAIGREIGRYITVETPKAYEIGEPAFEEIADAVAEEALEAKITETYNNQVAAWIEEAAPVYHTDRF